jgi:hypothetical protein
LVLRVSVALIAAFTIIALIFDRVVAQGLLIGGLAGIAGFRMMTRHTVCRGYSLSLFDKLWTNCVEVANAAVNGVKFGAQKWLASRLLLYAIVLYVAYNLDKVHVRGFLAAAAGLLIVRIAVTVVGVTGWDLKEPEQ